MRTPQELREIILRLLDEQGTNAHQMLIKCEYNTSLVNDLKKGQMPSADKIATIAKFLGVTTDYLLGVEPGENAGKDADSDFDLLENLRRELYGNPAVKITPEDKQRILDIVKLMR